MAQLLVETSNKKRDIFILDTPTFPCQLVLKYVFTEMCGAFERNGHKVIVASSLAQLHNNSIVIIANKNITDKSANFLNHYAPEAIYIAWHWDEPGIPDVDTTQLKYFIYTYQNTLNLSAEPLYGPFWTKSRERKYNAPLLLRANEHPSMIGNYNRNTVLDYCYMGWVYNVEMVPSYPKYNGLYHATYHHTQFLSYNDRKKYYLSSLVALGFQSKENIENEHVSQRIYEGLAYGCVVLTNSMPAVVQTEGIAIYVSSREEIERYIDYYKTHPQEHRELQERGYEFIRREGTNHNSIQKFVDIIEGPMGLSV